MAELRGLLDLQQVETTLYFSAAGGFSEANMTTLGTDLVTWWDDNLAPILSSEFSLTECFLTDLRTATSPTVSVGPFTTHLGDVGSDSLPNNCALCVSFRTNARGKSSRGRNYLCGIPEASVNGSIIDNTVIAAAVAAYTELRTGGILGIFQWVVCSRFTGGAPRTEGLTRPVTGELVTNPAIASQRRRRPGVGV